MTPRSMPLVLLIAFVSVLYSATARAQILPRTPPPPSPRVEYIPPPPPPKPADIAPPEPEPDVPSLVVRDAAGKLKIIPGLPEDAAVRSISFKPEQRRKVETSIQARGRDIEKWTVENFDKVRVALAARKEVEHISSFDQLARAKDAINPVKQEGVIERLMRDGAISTALKVSIDRVVTEYVEARRDEWQKDTGADVMKIATLIGQQGFADQTSDASAALDRLTRRLAPTFAAETQGIDLNPEQRAKLDQVIKDGVPPAGVRAFVVETLTPEQARTLLAKHISPAPK